MAEPGQTPNSTKLSRLVSSSSGTWRESSTEKRAPHGAVIDRSLTEFVCDTLRGTQQHRRQSKMQRRTQGTQSEEALTERGELLATGAAKEEDCG